MTTHLVAWNNTDLSTPRSGGQKPGGEPPALHLPELFLLPGLGLGEHLTVPSSAQLSQLREGSSAGIFQPLTEMGAAETPGPPCSLRRKLPSSAQQCLCPPWSAQSTQGWLQAGGQREGPRGQPCLHQGFGKEGSPHVPEAEAKPQGGSETGLPSPGSWKPPARVGGRVWGGISPVSPGALLGQAGRLG